jgi:predicted AAA+ superfamily ATPase
MPEAVFSFCKDRDFKKVRKIQNNILSAYNRDFSKHISAIVASRIRMLWNTIPNQFAKENKKFIYGIIRQGARASDYEHALMWLSDCGLAYKVTKAQKNELPLKFYEDINCFKLFVLDVGLLSAMCKIDPKLFIDMKIFKEYKGSLTEQFVFQQLKTFEELDIYYWANQNLCELDFLLQFEDLIIPVEVKAEINLKAKSLKQYCQQYNPPLSLRLSMSDYKKTDNLKDIPLYMVESLLNIIKN